VHGGGQLKLQRSQDGEVVIAKSSHLFVNKALDPAACEVLNQECGVLKEHMKTTTYVGSAQVGKKEAIYSIAKASAKKRFQRDLLTTGGRFRKALARLMRSRVRSRVQRESVENQARSESLMAQAKDPKEHWSQSQAARLKADANLYNDFVKDRPLLERLKRTYGAAQKLTRRAK